MRVVVFTTSYPRHKGDYAGCFIADAVERLRNEGIEIDVVGPGAYRDFGLAYGAGIVANAKRRPWRALPMVISMIRTLRRTARGADLIHAHWLLGAVIARFGGRPFIVTLHGSGTAGRFEDLSLARRSPKLVTKILRPAKAVIAVSKPLADAASKCTSNPVSWIPNGVEISEAAPADDNESQPHVLFAGRLSPEKGIREFVQATHDLPRVIVGDGPLRSEAPDTVGTVPHDKMADYYRDAAVVALPSFREGLPLVLTEAMALGKAVVATPVGGIPELIENEETGLLVPAGDVNALSKAIQRLLGDAALRKRLGDAGRIRVSQLCSWDPVIEKTLAVYKDTTRR